MGAPADERGATSREQPRHGVTLTKDFWIGKYEVTQAQFRAVMGTEPWKGQPYVQLGATVPASYIDWWSAATFCANAL